MKTTTFNFFFVENKKSHKWQDASKLNVCDLNDCFTKTVTVCAQCLPSSRDLQRFLTMMKQKKVISCFDERNSVNEL